MRIECFAFFLLATVSCQEPSERILITHGPLLGRPGPESIGIWARTNKPGAFRVEYGMDPANLDMISQPAETSLERDNTGWVLIEGLTPDTKYHYRLLPGDPSKHSGTFRTMPDSELFRNDSLNPEGLFNFSFEFACGNNQNEGHGLGTSLPSFRTIIDEFADEILFSIQNGDWMYETKERGYSVEKWCRQVNIPEEDTPRNLQIAPSLAGVWENYKGYLDRGTNLAEFHRFVPCLYTFDDHEILNDVIGCGQAGYRNRRSVFRDIGVQAWYDYLGWSNPVSSTREIHFGQGKLEEGGDVLYDPEADFTLIDPDQNVNLHVHWGTETAGVDETRLDSIKGDPNAGVYDIVEILDANRVRISPPAIVDGLSAYSTGRISWFSKKVGNCDFFFLDTRSHRMVHDHLNPENPEKTMLGSQQIEWLVNGIKSSDADFIFVVSSVNFMIPHISGGALVVSHKDDAWTAFRHERELLIRIADQASAPVFMLTGDLHNSFAIKITDNVWEFASGPRNSRNHKYTDEGKRPATGLFTYGDRTCDIRWSTYFLDDAEYADLLHPTFCIVQVNNVTNSPVVPGGTRLIAYERPQVVFRYYSGTTGDLLYAEAITAKEN